MPIDALSVLCAQLTNDLLAIAKFLFIQIFLARYLGDGATDWREILYGSAHNYVPDVSSPLLSLAETSFSTPESSKYSVPQK